METNKTKHPYLFSILSGIFCTFMTGLGLSVSAALKLNIETQFMVISAILAVSVLIAVLIIKFNNITFSLCGFCKPDGKSLKKVLYFLPIIIVDAMYLAGGFAQGITVKQYFALLLFVIAVGFNEEIYFRGLAVYFLRTKGKKTAIIVSSIIFGALHAANALSGKNVTYILLQIILAFCIGFVFSELFFLTKSIWPLILLHALQDYTANIAGSLFEGKMIFIAIQVLILFIYASFLWIKLNQTDNDEEKG